MVLSSVVENEFSSRGKALDLLRKRVEGFTKGSKQNVAIIGREYIGKSTLLLKFYYELLDSRQVFPVYLELREEPFQLLEKRFLEAILSFFRERYGDGLEEELPVKHPGFFEEFSRMTRSPRKSQEQALSGMFGLLGALQAEIGAPVVFILDEFQRLSCCRVKNPYAMLGERIMTQKEVMYLVSSSAIKRAKDILDNDLSLLFGNFEVHELGPFTVDEAHVFAEQNLPGLEMPPELLYFLLSITGNNPFYMESILGDIHRAVRRAGGTGVNADDLCGAAAEQLHNPASPVHKFFLDTLGSCLDFRSAQDFEILFAVAGGCKKSSRIAKAISKSSSQTTRKLEKFVNADILLRFGQVYDYADPLLELWVGSVYRHRCFSFKPVQDVCAREQTKNSVRNMLASFIFSHGMDIGDRLRRLFGLFDGDHVQLAGRSAKLPKFRSVSRMSPSGFRVPVMASTGYRNPWILDYRGGVVTEYDITAFLEKLKGFPGRGVKIFLCLGGIETDAKLLAKEKEIWLWTVNDLNTLCGVYGQPRIMLKENCNG